VVDSAALSIPVLATARSTLVPATPDDVDALWMLFTDPVVRRYLWDDAIITRDQVAETVGAAAQQNAEGRGLWTIRPRGADLVVGCVALLAVGSAAEFEPRMAGGIEVLVAVAPAVQQRGHATEALGALIGYAWRTLPIDTLYAAVDVPNEASHHAMLRAGFAVLGESDGPRYRLRTYHLARPAAA
jgi:RimJ/RimL family protein N-acetyltransferase